MIATYSTSAAAEIADVTIDTIRTWCRMGAVRATKVARRWIIDADSLAHRVSLGIRRTNKRSQIVYSVENMVAIGGSRWQRGDMDRVYFNDWPEFAGIETTRYGTGNISSATYQGEGISNSQGYKLLGSIDKLYFDVNTGKIHVRYGHSESRVASRREVFDAAVEGIRARIAAL